jgi:hypothetical protein
MSFILWVCNPDSGHSWRLDGFAIFKPGWSHWMGQWWMAHMCDKDAIPPASRVISSPILLCFLTGRQSIWSMSSRIRNGYGWRSHGFTLTPPTVLYHWCRLHDQLPPWSEELENCIQGGLYPLECGGQLAAAILTWNVVAWRTWSIGGILFRRTFMPVLCLQHAHSRFVQSCSEDRVP